uniref:Uncharacterized protein n=1 Tax=Arundo donax TaxID=35708 RepID=A0A0A8ZX60_ARUDO
MSSSGVATFVMAVAICPRVWHNIDTMATFGPSTVTTLGFFAGGGLLPEDSPALLLPNIVISSVPTCSFVGVPSSVSFGAFSVSVNSVARGSFPSLAYAPIAKLLPNIVAISW